MIIAVNIHRYVNLIESLSWNDHWTFNTTVHTTQLPVWNNVQNINMGINKMSDFKPSNIHIQILIDFRYQTPLD